MGLGVRSQRISTNAVRYENRINHSTPMYTFNNGRTYNHYIANKTIVQKKYIYSLSAACEVYVKMYLCQF